LAVTVRDITSEACLRLNERMDSIGMLAAGVAHESNNPLAFVSGNLGFIQDELRRQELPEEDQRELLKAISKAREGAERMRSSMASAGAGPKAQVLYEQAATWPGGVTSPARSSSGSRCSPSSNNWVT
jgi:hypothetical protein